MIMANCAIDHVLGFHACGQSQEQRNDGNGDDRVELEFRDEQDESDDRDGCDEQQRARGEDREG
ncbi:hypothetical protein CfE428DRAFT_3449 [Chthoniobacter flavus Ellin428]|uniref:Uncharacterized protein n=1 Tax=Chthoniobacter flavus Ellin428 TaxID=497964 RepID=B4D3G1_9BACT|nr:hypothetical protein CfE428DRAFT_3449 [Chthoniobacter flavus Ellin428]